MKTKLFSSFLLMTLFLLNLVADGQDKIIHGLVTTFDSLPIYGAQIKVKSTKQTIMTDTLGQFSAAVNKADRLKVKANGFYNQNVKLNENTKFAAVNLHLRPGEKNREYAIGYGHVTDRDKLNALASLNNRDLDFSQYHNMYELIRGRFAGVQVVNNEIIVRGINSINSSNAALIVVDGIPVDGSALNAIPPTHVKSINVIKDGGSAIFGSRGANGVVLIETKSGKD
jgi:TonB-dependent SusC/RagA subfamily outer membrane receptor